MNAVQISECVTTTEAKRFEADASALLLYPLPGVCNSPQQKCAADLV